MASILITTIGGTWIIAPELLSLFYADILLDDREKGVISDRLPEVDELWLVSTGGGSVKEATEKIRQWALVYLPELNIRTYLLDCEDITTKDHADKMQELIFRAVAEAHKCANSVFLSLAGGRKTMSSDMQKAAMIFGCEALIHVMDSPNTSHCKETYKDIEEIWDHYRNNMQQGKINPVILERKIPPSPLLDWDKLPDYNLNVTGLNDIQETTLKKHIDDMQSKANHLYLNQGKSQAQESSSNFRSLYALPAKEIQKLKDYKFGQNQKNREKEYSFLKSLPKAELHCHLGGVAHSKELIQIAKVVKKEYGHEDQWINAENFVQTYIGYIGREDSAGLKRALSSGSTKISSWKDVLAQHHEDQRSSFLTAAFILLFEGKPDLLDKFVFGGYTAETTYCGCKIETYEKLGDLQGSSLLQNRAAIKEVCRVLIEQCKEHNVQYIEVRCSPVNYTREGLSAVEVVKLINQCFAEGKEQGGPDFNLLFIASRHGQLSRICQHIELAEELCNSGYKANFAGFDLAGNEKKGKPSELRSLFIPVMKRCWHITIHAGEDTQADNIWEAVYHLNAERVGHGLSLLDKMELMELLRDRRIAVELCPSSNFQIVGYKDYCLDCGPVDKNYPAKKYLDAGIRVTVNTDNPGISRTDFSKELLKAAQMTEGGLSLWDLLKVVRNGFRSTFATFEDRKKCYLGAEEKVTECVDKWLKEQYETGRTLL
jgi:adenosine deaminase